MLVIAMIIGTVILIAILVLVMRLFSIERVDTSVSGKEASDSEDNDEEENDDEEESQETQEELGDKVNLFEYFDGDDEGKEKKTSEGQVEDVYSTPDKLTEFKVGRRYLVDCKNVLQLAREESHIYCAVYFDYDRFSYINSLKGALSGDYVLTHTAQNLRRILPEAALITRVSADHFAAVFPLIDMSMFDDYYEQLRRMCEKIRNDIAAKTGLRICVGFATTDNDASYDVTVLLARANIARHSAKVTKAEKFETYDESMIASNFFGDSMLDNYAECPYGDDVAIYFEKQIDLLSDKIIGCDTLVRWAYVDKSNELISQETGKIPTNNDKVIYQVCRAISRWRKASREVVSVFVDVPVTDVFKADVDEFIHKCLTEFQVEPQTLILKIDVSVIRIGWSMCSKQFKKFRELGVKICVTGIDVGYTNLDFLSGLLIDYIKIHKSFANGVDKDKEQLEKCRRITERCASIGARVIFEGVDSTDQVTALRTINAKTVQGKYSGRPATTDDLVRDLPEHVERRSSDQTVILDESQLAKGDWTLF